MASLFLHAMFTPFHGDARRASTIEYLIINYCNWRSISAISASPSRLRATIMPSLISAF